MPTSDLEANAHIPTPEIHMDIAETEAEIAALEAMRPGCDVLGDRVLRLRVNGGISQRREFVARLKQILEARVEAGRD